MRIALVVIASVAFGLAACSSSSGGGSASPAKTYIIMPNGQTSQATQCGPGTGTACP